MPAPAKRYKPAHPPLVTLRALREAYGITRDGLVERLAEHGYVSEGIKDKTAFIRGVENGHQKPSNELIIAWAKALRLNPADVILPENGDGGAAA